MIRLSSPIIDESVFAAVSDVLASGQLASGAQVVRFQDDFSRVATPGAQCLAVNSGTAALHVPLLAAGIGPGDEVILPAFTFAGTANAVAGAGATPVFADVDPKTALIDLDHAETLISHRTAAVIPVHLYGNPVNMDQCVSLAQRHSLFLLEDAAQAHLATFRGQPVGTFGGACGFSFYATKNMTTGEGGMISTVDEALAERCRVLLNQGQLERYVHTLPGWNYRMTNVAAAIGLAQLAQLRNWTQMRQSNATFLRTRLPQGVLLQETPGGEHVYHQFTIRVDEGLRNSLREHLASEGIQSDIYYPTPLHEQAAFRTDQDLPAAEALSKTVLSIPVHPALTQTDLERVADVVSDYLVRSGSERVG